MSVAVIGSSGGGTATLGHTDAGELLRSIHEELLKVKETRGIVSALFVSLHGGKGFDSAVETDKATLYSVSGECSVEVVKSGILKDVNEELKKLDKALAKKIWNDEIQGLICISCDVDLHALTLEAAAQKKIPVTGSGGTSLSAASSKFGIRLVGNAGGSVATTSYTRAVSYTYALATAWVKSYDALMSEKHMPQWTSVLCACLPAFWAAAVTCRVLRALPLGLDEGSKHVALLLQTHALPTVCSVVMATSLAPQHGSTVLMSSAIASIFCEKSILGGLFVGWLVALLATYILYRCIVWNIPATMINLIVAGGLGAVVGVFIAPAIPYLQLVTEAIRQIIHSCMSGWIPGIGFIIGAVFCWGSKYGYYHSVCLPLILVEMETGEAALCGAIDEATLVCVSAGICLANLIVTPKLDDQQGTQETLELSRRGLRINLLFGDFIEVAYPFMERSSLVNAAGYLASGLSTELLTGNSKEVLSSAYLPLPVAIILAQNQLKIALAFATAFIVSFSGAVISNLLPAVSKVSETLKKAE